MAPRTTFLFVLLLFSLSLPDVPAQVQKLCGSHFADEVQRVCGDRGIYSPWPRYGRDITMANGEFKINEHFKARRSDNIITQASDCCEMGCDEEDLDRFCNKA